MNETAEKLIAAIESVNLVAMSIVPTNKHRAERLERLQKINRELNELLQEVSAE